MPAVIGLTLVVAGDAYFGTLLAVIIFHQMFEGIALGSRIAAVGQHFRSITAHTITPPADPKVNDTTDNTEINHPVPESPAGHKTLTMPKKLLMATAFSITTPIGMAIGIGVLNQFNGNDPSTIIAIGTLDALSAGILIWVGVVEMWAGDWMFGGELEHAGVAKSLSAGVSMVAGMVLMSFLGKWA